METHPVPGWPCARLYPIASPAAASASGSSSLPHDPLLSLVVLNKGKVGTRPKLPPPLAEGAESGTAMLPGPSGMIEQRPGMD